MRTLPASASGPEVERYNAAFWDLGLRWSWDEGIWRGLADLPDDRARLSAYLRNHQPHLLASYPEDFLVGVITQRLATPGSGGRLGFEAFASI